MADGFILNNQRDVVDLLKMVQLFRAKGWLNGVAMPSEMGLIQNVPSLLYLKNDAGAEIPAYGCVQITGTEEIGDQNYLVADQPADNDGSAGWFLFNGPEPIADGELGVAQPGPVVRAFKNSGTITAGEKWQPVASQWYIEQDNDGLFVAAGADDIATDVLKVIAYGGVGSGTGSGGIVDLRLNGNELQYTFDNVTWTTWHTATTCP